MVSREEPVPDAPLVAPPESDLESNIVQTVFRWEHGGNNVYITGAIYTCP
jgi:hypothetical protein